MFNVNIKNEIMIIIFNYLIQYYSYNYIKNTYDLYNY